MGFYLVLFLTGLSSAATMFLVAAGLSIIFGVTRIVNFAHGSFFMLGAYIGLDLIELFGGRGSHLGFWAAVVGAGLAVGLVGALVEILVLRRIYKAPELFQLLATFGVILVVQDLALWVWGAEDQQGPRAPGLRGPVTIAGARLPAYDLVLIAACPVVLGLLWLLLRRTRWGVLVRAATADREMVGALGVNQAWLFTSVFVLGSFLAGLAGALQLPKGGASLLMDLNTIAAAFVVVVIGGMGSVAGALLASVIIGELQAFGVLLLPQLSLVTMFLAMAVVLVFRPWGLLGKPEGELPRGSVPAEPPLGLAGGRGAGAAWSLGVLALLLLPLGASDFALVLAIEVLILALFAASLHAIMGPGGLASFGHAAYFGGGAYAAALAATGLGWPVGAALALAPLGAGLLALAFGWFCVRLRGVYFAMLTLAFAQIAWSTAVQWTGLTGGDDGILGVWPTGWAAERRNFYWLVLALVLAGVLALRRAAASPFGFGLRAARDSVVRAEAVGVDVARQQWLAFALSGAMAGLAGGLFAFSKGSVFPDEMGIARSFDALMMVLLGGVQALDGPLAGAAAFTLLENALSRLELWRLLLGLAIIGLVLAFPGGLAGLLHRRRRGAAAR
jgi:branched-chain amino acid transport system permease protein